ncbi:MAG TPA: ABC transporter permease, partial [Mucilaginibacter sp.]
KSPLEYKNDRKKEQPSYNLGSQANFATLISYHETTPKWSKEKSNRNYMFKNYLKTAWRNLARNKSYAAINITGLAIGIAACLLIFLVVQFETSFDNFHTKRNSIYRVLTASKGPNGIDLGSGVPFPTSEGLRIDYPQLKGVAAIMRYGGQYSISDAGNKQVKKFKEDDAYYCEPQFFDIFDFDWLAGDKKTALSEPKTAVLTQEEAEKFFGDWHNAIGKVIRYNNQTDLKVTGILKNFPANTDFPVKMMVSYATMRQKGGDFNGNMNDWVSVFGSHYVFVVLPSNLSVNQFNQDLAAFVKKHKPADYVKEGMQLQPLSDMHYNTKVHIFGDHTPFGKELISAISLIGVFLLLIACVNFINLATAQAVNRSKEVGVRKVLGGSRKQLMLQFLIETFIITLFAVVIAVLIAFIVISPLNKLLQTTLTDAMLFQPIVIAFIGAAIACVTLLSGFYPAIVLSGFNPIIALKNKIAAGKTNGISLRRALVVLQFCIAQALVIGTLVIIYQMNYFRNQSLGFDKDAVITVSFPNDSLNQLKLPALRNQLLQQSGIKDVSFSFSSPSDNSGWSTDFKYNNSPKKTDFQTSLKWADADYFNLYKLQFVAGHAYKKSDTISGYVVNETLLHKLGVNDPKEAIGKYINMWDDKKKYARIVGVVKDFNVSSLKNAIPPVLMASWRDVFQDINIKIQPVAINNTLASVEKIWNKTFPDGIYQYQFLDEKIENFYKNDAELSVLYKTFAGIAIFISCLGLYGLVSFMAVQRTKEVGIRKTLGASVGHIVYLFSKEFTLLIIIAFLISAPIGYYFMHKWLQDFAYKVSIGPGIFILAILVSVAIAWATVGYKAVKAALANPVKSLRSE